MRGVNVHGYKRAWVCIGAAGMAGSKSQVGGAPGAKRKPNEILTRKQIDIDRPDKVPGQVPGDKGAFAGLCHISNNILQRVTAPEKAVETLSDIVRSRSNTRNDSPP